MSLSANTKCSGKAKDIFDVLRKVGVCPFFRSVSWTFTSALPRSSIVIGTVVRVILVAFA